MVEAPIIDTSVIVKPPDAAGQRLAPSDLAAAREEGRGACHDQHVQQALHRRSCMND